MSRRALISQGLSLLARGFSPRQPPIRNEAYAGAEMNRLLLDWATSIIAPDEAIKRGGRVLRARARDLAINNAYAAKYLNVVAANVIGPNGFTLQSEVRRGSGELWEKANQAIEAAWKAWAEGPVTTDGKHSLVEAERLLIKAVARDGEAFARKYRGVEFNPHGLALQPIDADMLDEQFNQAPGTNRPGIRLGVEVSPVGKPLAYHFWSYDPGSPQPYGDYQAGRRRQRIEAGEVIHLYIPERLNQSRGVTWFAPVMSAMKMLDGYEEAEVVAARICAAKMVFFEAKGDGVGEANPNAKISMDASPGSGEQLPPGWQANFWDPQHPSTAFGDFVKSASRKISTGLPGGSYNVLADDLESVNYSSSRAGAAREQDAWRPLQSYWIRAFRRDVFEAWLPMAIATGQLVLPGGSMDPTGMNAACWRGRRWPSPNPREDAEAAILQMLAGLGSPQEYLGEKGREMEDVFAEIAEARALAERLGISIDATGFWNVKGGNGANNGGNGQ